MKNILIATDFSGASRTAAMYGAALARQFGANIFLFHAYQTPIQVPESYVLYTSDDVWAAAKELLQKEIEAINPSGDLNIEITGGEGMATQAILKEAERVKADLIICGMKSDAKPFRRLFGSSTTGLAKHSDVPFIVVPENAHFRSIKKIALANDMDSETAVETTRVLQEIGEHFSAALSIVLVVDEEFDKDKEFRFLPLTLAKNLKSLKPVLEFPKGENIVKVLDDFAIGNNIDLMAVIPHKHSFLERLIIESTTNKLIFHTHVPLLVMPQKKNGELADATNHAVLEKHS